MKLRRLSGLCLALAVCLLWPGMIVGCHGTRIAIEDGRDYRGAPSHHKPAGPPPWAPAHGYRAKHRYRYYPSSHVYYDIGRGLYFHYGDGHWRVSVSFPAGIHIDVNDYVTLEMDTSRPYEHHSEVVKRYPHGHMKKKYKKKGKKWK